MAGFTRYQASSSPTVKFTVELALSTEAGTLLVVVEAVPSAALRMP